MHGGGATSVVIFDQNVFVCKVSFILRVFASVFFFMLFILNSGFFPWYYLVRGKLLDTEIEESFRGNVEFEVVGIGSVSGISEFIETRNKIATDSSSGDVAAGEEVLQIIRIDGEISVQTKVFRSLVIDSLLFNVFR